MSPPPPPPIDVVQYMYHDSTTNRNVPYYYHNRTGATQWDEAAEPHIPYVLMDAKEEEKTSEETSASEESETDEWVPGKPWRWDVRVRCAQCDRIMGLASFHNRYHSYSCELRFCKDCV